MHHITSFASLDRTMAWVILGATNKESANIPKKTQDIAFNALCRLLGLVPDHMQVAYGRGQVKFIGQIGRVLDTQDKKSYWTICSTCSQMKHIPIGNNCICEDCVKDAQLAADSEESKPEKAPKPRAKKAASKAKSRKKS